MKVTDFYDEDPVTYQDLVPVSSTTQSEQDPMVGGDIFINYTDYEGAPLPYPSDTTNDILIPAVEGMVVTDSYTSPSEIHNIMPLQSSSDMFPEIGEEESMITTPELSPQILENSYYRSNSVQSYRSHYSSLPSILGTETITGQTGQRKKKISYRSDTAPSPPGSSSERKVGRPRLPLDLEGRRKRKNRIAEESRKRCREAQQKQDDKLQKEIERYKIHNADLHIKLTILKLESKICNHCCKPRAVSV
ncbi:hypothetical protein FO519_000174 [Halicephalobus sp. NKZ332]|nr:hypothetical protein FO519_000174 [Halicephalobus sp. NKZ332]